MSQHVRLFRISMPRKTAANNVTSIKPKASTTEPVIASNKKTVIVRLSVTRDQVTKYIQKYRLEHCIDVPKYEDSSSRRDKLMTKRVVYRVSKLMPAFGEVWPNSSPYRCYSCHHTFTTKPRGIPEKIEDGEPHLYANFCSFNCAHNYLHRGGEPDVDQCTFDELQERKQLLSWVELAETGRITVMKRTPFHLLKEYGGNQEIAAVRQKVAAGLNLSCNIEKPPMKTFHFRVVEEQQ